MAEINPNDQNTWPEEYEDFDKLVDMAAADSGAPTPGETGAEPQAQTQEATPPAEVAAEPSGTAASGEQPPAPEGSEASEVTEAPQEPPAATPPTTREAAPAEPELPVMTADGKHFIPHNVLKDARSEVASLKAQLAELQKQQAAPAAAAPAAQAPAAAPEQPTDDLTPEQRAKVEAIRGEWGDDNASQWEQTFRMQLALEAQQQELQRATSLAQQVHNVQARSEEEIIEAAITASPSLDSWRDTPHWQQALDMHSMLMKSDPVYARKSWHDQFQELPQKVSSVFGAPLAQAVAESTPPAAKADVQGKVAQAKQQADTSAAVPPSMAAIPGGTTDTPTPAQSLGNMSPEQLQEHMASIASKPGALDAYLLGLE